MEEKGKCEARSKRFFPTHKQQSSRSYRKVSEHSGAQRSNVSPECCFGKWRRQTRSCIGHKTTGNNTRKLKRDVLGRRRPLYILGKCGLCQPKYKKIRILVVKTKSFCTKKENKSSGIPLPYKNTQTKQNCENYKKSWKMRQNICNRYARRALSGVSL